MHSKEEAYKLTSSRSHKSYYDKWASKYDEEFVRAENYKYPEIISNIFRKLGGNKYNPIADIGCGTGVLGEQFVGENLILDGFDISAKMLSEAKRKNVYRRLIECDITKPNELPSTLYGGAISCGTFTLGHLGPKHIKKVVEILVEDGLAVIGINKEHFLKEGFDNEVSKLEATKQIKKVNFFEAEIYRNDSEKTLYSIPNDRIAKILTFHK